MASAPIDYNALAAQAGALSSSAPPAPAAAPVATAVTTAGNAPAGSGGPGVDYAALAKQAGAVSSTPAPGAGASSGAAASLDWAKVIGLSRKDNVPDDEVLAYAGQFEPQLAPGIAQAKADGRSSTDILNELAKTGKIGPAPASAFDQLVQGAKDYAKGLGSQLNPVTMAQGVDQAFYHPIDTAKSLLQAQANVGQEAAHSFESGDYLEGIKHGLLYLLPVVGPQVDAMSNKAESGHLAESLGEATGAGLLMAAPENQAVKGAVKAGANKVADAAAESAADLKNAVAEKLALPRSGTPEQQAAVDWALANGAPLDAASATLNPIVRGAQELSQTTMGSGSMAQRAIRARNEWFAQQGRALAGQITPESATPEMAGRAVYDRSVQEIRGANTEASDAYAQLKQFEADPRNTKPVQVGTKEVASSLSDASGNPIGTQQIPVYEHVPIPVDMREFKQSLAPALEDIRRQVRLGQSHYAPAQIALEDIVNGPDFQRASTAEANLGALKQVSRQNTLVGGVKNEAGALASTAIPKLQGAIDQAVATQAGPDALNALRVGRAKTAGKYSAVNLVDQYRAEPVKLYQQLTQARDGGIDFLRQVQALAPEQMAGLGRAWLDGALDHATESGGFGHAAKLYADWQRLGPETKKILFASEANPNLASDLDKFFQAAKDAAAVENASGTARVAHITSQGAMLFASPLVGGSYLVAGNVLSRLLYNPKFVRAAIRGFGVNAADRGAAALATAQLAEAAGKAAVRVGEAARPVATGSGPDTAAGVVRSGTAQARAEAGQWSDGATQRTAGDAGAAGQSATVSESLRGSAPQAGVPGRGNSTVVRVPGQSRGYQARYEVRELSDIQPSHNGSNFTANPKYGLSNDRNYGNAANQAKIVNWSARGQYDPSFLLTDNPDATNGPPVLDSDGNVLGGNGRVMIQQRVYRGNATGAASYRDQLVGKAAQFGIDPKTVRGMKQPVLVRVIDDNEFVGGAGKANAITDFNVKPTAELTPGERAIADSRRVSDATLEDMAGRLEAKGSSATLADVLEGRAGIDVLNKLIQDGVIAPQERAAFAGADELTKAGRERVAALVVGRFFSDPAQLDTIPASIRAKVERLAAPLAQVEGRGAWSLTGDVQEALGLLDRAHKLGFKNIDDYIAQDGLFGKQQYSEQGITLAKALQGMKPTQLTAAARQYAQDAAFAAKGDSMFGAAPEPRAAFAEAFGAGKKVIVPSETSRPYDAPRLTGNRNEAYPLNAKDEDHLKLARFERIPLAAEDAKNAVAVTANLSGFEWINRMSGEPADQLLGDPQAHHFSPTKLSAVLHNLQVDEQLTGAGVPGIDQLRQAVQEAKSSGRSLIIVKDHVAAADAVRAQALNEELNHALQRASTGPLEAHLRGDASDFTQGSLARAALQSLRQKFQYSFTSPGQAAAEIGVRLMHPGQYAELGLTRAEARVLAREYMQRLEKEYGRDAVSRISEKVRSSFP